jgi:hypothetical protein
VSSGKPYGVLKEYGVPEKIVKMIKILYGKFSPFFAVETGVKQGCLLSGLLLIIVVDWLMKQTTEALPEGVNTGLEWIDGQVFEDLDYTDDLGLVSEGIDDLQRKTIRLSRRGKSVGLKISAKKTKILRVCTDNERQVKLDGEVLEDVDEFVYLGSNVSKEDQRRTCSFSCYLPIPSHQRL